jgi:hypothetical protein
MTQPGKSRGSRGGRRNRFAGDARCEYDNCTGMAEYEVKTAFIPWLKLCSTHRREWHRLSYRQMEEVSATRQ